LLVQLLQQLVQLLVHEPVLILLVFEGERDLPVFQGDVVAIGGVVEDEEGDCQDKVEIYGGFFTPTFQRQKSYTNTGKTGTKY
jgi:hypothetical protein